MKNAATVIMCCVLLLAVISCGLIEKFTDSGTMTKANDLWSDVPRMDGLKPSDLELPIGVKFLMRTALNNLWRFNKEGEDKTPVNGDWIVFTTSGTPDDVQKFYTTDRMAGFGQWDTGKDSTCLDSKDKDAKGLMCVFHKTTEKKEMLLAIFGARDDDKKVTNIFFMRLEKDVDPTKKTPATGNKK